MTCAIAYVSLGSNHGDAPANLAGALARLADLPGLAVTAASGVYLTEPQDYREQSWFHNQVAALACGPEITPDNLLDSLLNIEENLGRIRDPKNRFGPRVIDLDLLLFGHEVRKEAEGRLILPHPRLARRAFVLVPLLELEPGLVLPDGTKAEKLLAQLPYRVQGNKIHQA